MKMKKILLLGDSLTQGGTDDEGGWAQRLSSRYSRRADVLNRGLSGYQTGWTLDVLDELLEDVKGADVWFATLWFGANDACIPAEQGGGDPRRHVPLADFKNNLLEIGEKLLQVTDCLIVMTAPPIFEKQLVDHGVRKYGKYVAGREQSVTKQYAEAATEVATELFVKYKSDANKKITCIDMNALFSPVKHVVFYDGLHFNGGGQRMIYESLVSKLEDSELFPDMALATDPERGIFGNSGAQKANGSKWDPVYPWNEHFPSKYMAG